MMLTVLNSLTGAAEYLKKKGIESPRLNAELLLSDILKCKRLELYLLFDRPLSEDETDKYRDYIRRRAIFEPLQYIIGKVEFFGLEFEVDNSVLIPRPETELLVETVINSVNFESEINILDIGCGSGNISVSLAKKIPNCKVIGIDIIENSLTLAKRNSQKNEVSEKVVFLKQNIFEGFGDNKVNFEVIVSNPPYISAVEFEKLDPELKLYEPKAALTDGNDGLEFYRKICSLTGLLLKKEGKIFLELGSGQADTVSRIFYENHIGMVDIKKDYSGIDRVIIGELN